MTGNTTSPGKYCVAMTAPEEILRMPQVKHMVVVSLYGRCNARATRMPTTKPLMANARIKRATSRRTAFMCSTYSLMAVELEAITPIIMNLQAGESAGESFSCPQPCVSSLITMPSTAGMAIIKAMFCIMLGTSIATVAPNRSLSVSGIVTGDITEDVRMMVSASGPLPPNMLIHIKAVTATGTLYSSTMPQTRLGLEPKNNDPMA